MSAKLSVVRCDDHERIIIAKEEKIENIPAVHMQFESVAAEKLYIVDNSLPRPSNEAEHHSTINKNKLSLIGPKFDNYPMSVAFTYQREGVCTCLT